MGYNRNDTPNTGTRVRVVNAENHPDLSNGDVGIISHQDGTSCPYFIMDKRPTETGIYSITRFEPESITVVADPTIPEKLKIIATLLLSLTVREMDMLEGVMEKASDDVFMDITNACVLLAMADRLLAAG